MLDSLICVCVRMCVCVCAWVWVCVGRRVPRPCPPPLFTHCKQPKAVGGKSLGTAILGTRLKYTTLHTQHVMPTQCAKANTYAYWQSVCALSPTHSGDCILALFNRDSDYTVVTMTTQQEI